MYIFYRIFATLPIAIQIFRLSGGGFTTYRVDGACAGVAVCREPAVRRHTIDT